jgi:nicotinic acid mononucleotide adenylyltransferase
MNYELKYLKYKSKYLQLKKNQLVGGADDEEKTIHIYNGGSFSPPTIAHQQICIDTFGFLMDHFRDSPIDTIILHLIPTSDMYDKPSVKPDCIPYEERRKMLEIMAQNIREKIVPKNKAYTLSVIVDDIEQRIAHEAKPDGSGGVNGFIGTYKYLAEFARRNKFIPENIYLLYGLDNAISLNTSTEGADGKIKRWKNPIHLISKFKFLIYPRSGASIDYNLLARLFDANIGLFMSKPEGQEEINLSDKGGINSLEDIDTQLKSFGANPIQFMKEHFIEVSGAAAAGSASGDSISIAETSSSNIRKVLYDYSTAANSGDGSAGSAGFTIKESKINEILETVDPRIRSIVRGLYRNGNACEGAVKFAEIVASIPADWKN